MPSLGLFDSVKRSGEPDDEVDRRSAMLSGALSCAKCLAGSWSASVSAKSVWPGSSRP
jgi:hypothetical protein